MKLIMFVGKKELWDPLNASISLEECFISLLDNIHLLFLSIQSP